MTELVVAWFGFEVAGLGSYNPSYTDRCSLAKGPSEEARAVPGDRPTGNLEISRQAEASWISD
jgi:hypothetical protein